MKGTTKAEVLAAGWELDRHGLIKNPGRFQAEKWWAIYYTWMAECGEADGEITGPLMHTAYLFSITGEEKKGAPELEGWKTVLAWGTKEGFVCVVLSDNSIEWWKNNKK
jgi:hypothetical protein